MRWMIQGADANSGLDVTVEIEADDQRAAELEGKKRRILIASIQPVPEPTVSLDAIKEAAQAAAVAPTAEDMPNQVEFRRAWSQASSAPAANAVGTAGHNPPMQSLAPLQTRGQVVPTYPELVAIANRVQMLGSIIDAIGWLQVLGGVIGAGLIGLLAGALPGFIVLSAGLIGGVLYIGLAAVFQLFARMGLVLRDIGRNSFKE